MKKTKAEKIIHYGGMIVNTFTWAATIGFGFLFVVAKCTDYKRMKKGGKKV